MGSSKQPCPEVKRKSLVFTNDFLADIEQEGSDYSLFVVKGTPSHEGISKLILRPGNGEHVEGSNSRRYIELVAYAEGDPDPFESTDELGKPQSLSFSSDEDDDVILPCLQLAVESMEIHEVALFVSVPDYAYGPLGDPPRILPNSRVLLIIELLREDEVDERYRMPLISMSADDRQKYFSFQEIADEAISLNNSGNSKFHSGDFQRALSRYENAVRILHEYKLVSPETECDEKNDTLEEYRGKRDYFLYKLYNNIADTYIHLQQPQKVVETYHEKILKQLSMPDHRFLLRLARAYLELSKVKTSIRVLNDALKRSPNHRRIIELKKEAEALHAKENGVTEKLAKRLTGLNIGNGDSPIHPRPYQAFSKTLGAIFARTSGRSNKMQGGLPFIFQYSGQESETQTQIKLAQGFGRRLSISK